MIFKIVTFSVSSTNISSSAVSSRSTGKPLFSPPSSIFVCKYLCSDQIYCCIIKFSVTLQKKVHLGCHPLSSGHTTQFQTQAPRPSFPGFIRENYFLDIFRSPICKLDVVLLSLLSLLYNSFRPASLALNVSSPP